MRFLLLLALIALFSPSGAQEFSIGRYETEFSDPGRNGRKVPVSIFYPADSSGEKVSLAGKPDTKFPVIIFAHGYLSKTKSYENIRKMIIPEGYIVIFPETESGLFPDHKALARDMIFLADKLSELSENENTLFAGRISAEICLMGHSMGGGCAFLAAAEQPGVNTIITLAAYDRKREISDAALNIEVPALLFGGSKDPVTPPEKNQLPIYESLQSEYKSFINIIGGSHCQMSDQHKSCKLSELLLFSTPDISRDKQHEILEAFILPWLSFHLKGNEGAMDEFNSLLFEVGPISFVRDVPED